jgi:hypothetical protein
MVDLWFFLTIAVVVWGIVEILQFRIKTKNQKEIQANSETNKLLEDKTVRLERRIQNLETVIAQLDPESKTAFPSSTETPVKPPGDRDPEPGKIHNKLRDR